MAAKLKCVQADRLQAGDIVHEADHPRLRGIVRSVRERRDDLLVHVENERSGCEVDPSDWMVITRL